MLARVTAAWKFDPAFVTEVEVSFSAQGSEQPRVDMEHRDLERAGTAALDLRKAIDSPGGWGKIMDEFGKAAERD